MKRCQTCHNFYDKCFEVTIKDHTYSFDSFECAIQLLAPRCTHCGCKIIGHGVEENEKIYCCAHCARKEGMEELRDRA